MICQSYSSHGQKFGFRPQQGGGTYKHPSLSWDHGSVVQGKVGPEIDKASRRLNFSFKSAQFMIDIG